MLFFIWAAFPPSVPAFLFRFAPQKELHSRRAATVTVPVWPATGMLSDSFQSAF